MTPPIVGQFLLEKSVEASAGMGQPQSRYPKPVFPPAFTWKSHSFPRIASSDGQKIPPSLRAPFAVAPIRFGRLPNGKDAVLIKMMRMA